MVFPFCGTGAWCIQDHGGFTGALCLFGANGDFPDIFRHRGGRFNLRKALILSGVLCTASYLMVVFSPTPDVTYRLCPGWSFSGNLLAGCIQPFSGDLSRGGTAMFAILALAGDVGCSAGPALLEWYPIKYRTGVPDSFQPFLKVRI